MNFRISRWTSAFTDSGKPKIILTEAPKGMPYKFRLLDDDGVVGAYGYSAHNHLSEEGYVFMPLDAYSYDYGFTEIQYMVNGKWETI
jgi:hypothetical protein